MPHYRCPEACPSIGHSMLRGNEGFNRSTKKFLQIRQLPELPPWDARCRIIRSAVLRPWLPRFYAIPQILRWAMPVVPFVNAHTDAMMEWRLEKATRPAVLG
ncbi:hypothetical protein CIRG_09480 [Coccidioides immitis RMSCC 2394]|uniref:Uncharacterized protein n=1 Tax=Coccidioides immitis RMSCC 2394 TaxID=404692 RepID=A0A0J6YNM3_COCIT|nr:hypothetical protein CIRG_09480 [Coccidioides immitis RMSCC 2394]